MKEDVVNQMAHQKQLVFQDTKPRNEEKTSEVSKYRLITYPADFTVELLVMKLKQGEIVIPTFQRRFVWTVSKASKLIESFLLGLPVPQIFLYREEKRQDLLVVDGHQRLKTIEFFLDEKFDTGSTFYLRGVKAKWEGKKYSDLCETDKRTLRNSILRAIIFEQTDPKDKTSMFEVFERLNTGGMPLSSQEIRNCLHRGPIRDFLKKLNRYEKWRMLIGKKNPDKRMRDIELILRFFALYENWEKYKKGMKILLNEYMADNKDLSKSKQEEYEKIFKKIIDKIYDEIGIKAFVISRGVNAAVLDSIMVALGNIEIENIANLKEKYNKLMENPQYIENVSKWTTDKDRVQGRIKIAIGTFRE